LPVDVLAKKNKFFNNIKTIIILTR